MKLETLEKANNLVKEIYKLKGFLEKAPTKNMFIYIQGIGKLEINSSLKSEIIKRYTDKLIKLEKELEEL